MKSVYFKLAPVLLVVISPAIIHDDVHGKIISLKKVTAYDFQPGILTAITNYVQDVNGKEPSCYDLSAGKKRFFIVFNSMVTGEITAKNMSSRKGYPGILPVNEGIFLQDQVQQTIRVQDLQVKPYHETIF